MLSKFGWCMLLISLGSVSTSKCYGCVRNIECATSILDCEDVSLSNELIEIGLHLKLDMDEKNLGGKVVCYFLLVSDGNMANATKGCLKEKYSGKPFCQFVKEFGANHQLQTDCITCRRNLCNLFGEGEGKSSAFSVENIYMPAHSLLIVIYLITVVRY